jgi:activator of HSP90 ATPase
MTYSFEVTDVLPATPEEITDAWLSTEDHTAMTGGRAIIDSTPGGPFEAWDGYITGCTLEIERGRRIVQSWRTSEFTDDDPDSVIEVQVKPEGELTRITIIHSKVPDGQTSYEHGGWQENYFDPMRTYFSRR